MELVINHTGEHGMFLTIFQECMKNIQVVNFTWLFQIVSKLQQTCQFHQVATSLLKYSFFVATSHLQTCYNLSKRLATSLWITNFGNQLATSLLTTCNRLVVNNLLQAMQTYQGAFHVIRTPDIRQSNIFLHQHSSILTPIAAKGKQRVDI